jgi:hypothetical protein
MDEMDNKKQEFVLNKKKVDSTAKDVQPKKKVVIKKKPATSTSSSTGDSSVKVQKKESVRIVVKKTSDSSSKVDSESKASVEKSNPVTEVNSANKTENSSFIISGQEYQNYRQKQICRHKGKVYRTVLKPIQLLKQSPDRYYKGLGYSIQKSNKSVFSHNEPRHHRADEHSYLYSR